MLTDRTKMIVQRRPLRSLLVWSVLALTCASDPASAVALLNGSSLSVNGLTIGVSGCQLTLAGASQSSCAPGNLEIVQDSGPGAAIRIQGIGGGNIFSAALGSGLYDVSFTLNVTSLLPTTVSQASLGIAGSASGTLCPPFNVFPIGSYVSVKETIAGTSNNGNMSVNLAGGPTTASRNFAPDTSFSVTKNLRLFAAPGDGSLTLSYVTQRYTPAPEPASIGLLLAGIGGIAAFRRRKSRRGLAS